MRKKRFREYGERFTNGIEIREEFQVGARDEGKKKRKDMKETEYRNWEWLAMDVPGSCTIARKCADEKPGSKKFPCISRRLTEKRKVESKWKVFEGRDKKIRGEASYLPLPIKSFNQRQLLYGGYIESRNAAYIRCNPYDC